MNKKLLILSLLLIAVSPLCGMRNHFDSFRQKDRQEFKSKFLKKKLETVGVMNSINKEFLKKELELKKEVGIELSYNKKKCKRLLIKRLKRIERGCNKCNDSKFLTPIITDWLMRFSCGNLDSQRIEEWKVEVSYFQKEYFNIPTLDSEVVATLHMLFPEAKIGIIQNSNQFGNLLGYFGEFNLDIDGLVSAPIFTKDIILERERLEKAF